MQDRLAALVRRAVIAAASISVAVLAWAIFARYFAIPDLVPSPWDTFGTGASMISSGALLSHVGISLERVLVGYAAGCILGVLIGALMGRIQIVRQFADPLLQLMRPISPVALVPLSIIWFGIGDLSRYFIIFYGVVIIMISGLLELPRLPIFGSTPHVVLAQGQDRFFGVLSFLRRCLTF
jgi:ABC-type nitrate/sulfonate/bicarbonate transport system permease component